MPAFLRHADVQMLLARLELPFIPPSLPGACASITVDVPDDVLPERQPLVDLELGLTDSHDDHANTRNTDKELPRLPRQLSEAALVEIKENADPAAACRRRWTSSDLQSLSQADYSKMPEGMCTLVASKASRALNDQTLKYQALLKEAKGLKRKNKIQQAQLEKKQKLLDDARKTSGLEIVTAGSTGKRLATQGIYAVGIRRNLSNISAADFGATVLRSISHQRVCRSEVRTGATILARMRARCAAAVGALSNIVTEEQSWGIVNVSFRCDATNSSIWKREKLHVLDVDLARVKDHAAVRAFNARGAFECHRCLFGPWLFHATCVLTLRML